jgi:CubicO group peptidase (beta-lactamase class C family)
MFRNASMTKAVATTAALQFVEKGPLGLDAAVELILPEFRKLLPFFDMPVIETLVGFDMAVYQQVEAAVPAAWRQSASGVIGSNCLRAQVGALAVVFE